MMHMYTCIILQKVRLFVDRYIGVRFRFIYSKEPLGDEFFFICKPLFVECELHHVPFYIFN